MVMWDKSPPPVGNRVKGQFAIFRPLISVYTKINNTYKKSAKSLVLKNFLNVFSFYSYYKAKFLGNRSFEGNLQRLAKNIWGGVTQLVFLKNR